MDNSIIIYISFLLFLIALAIHEIADYFKQRRNFNKTLLSRTQKEAVRSFSYSRNSVNTTGKKH